ncbi:MAG: alternative oxidase [Bacteroidales bacterium]|nr:hypothetical protein [Anaerotignum sp.]MCI5678681.1 alternative oxidase [Bacteroidales bacterium]MDY3925960.1 hypothetical protein [Anaerotignum sp.]
MEKKEILKATVDLVSAYAGSLNENIAYLDEESVKAYTNFIETIYKKVEELTR